MEILSQRVQTALDSVRPYLKADGGDVELVEITKEMVVKLRMTGNCSSCDISHITMKAGLEEGILRAVPEIKSVVAV
ncbi:MAG: NifU family protein [Flavobacteriaceae bacterium]|nr:NifU family protein [Flavobacteriaceae bacterium]